MRPSTFGNIAILLFFVAASITAAVFGFAFVSSIENAASTTITAISVIFGLSAAISSITDPSRDELERAFSDPSESARVHEVIKTDREVNLKRQAILTTSAILCVIFGIVLLVAVKKSPDAISTRLLSAGFSGLATLTLLYTLFLPSILLQAHRRNLWLQSKSGK